MAGDVLPGGPAQGVSLRPEAVDTGTQQTVGDPRAKHPRSAAWHQTLDPMHLPSEETSRALPVHYDALMDEQTAGLAVAIGARVRQERQTRSWTLDQLAEVAGVSRRAVVNVEQGVANPSVGTLLRISDALGIGLPTLVAPPEPKPVMLTRAGQGAVLWTGNSGGRGVLVAGTDPPDVLELWDWTLAPGDRHDSEAHAAGTKELIHVLAGTLTLEVADQSYSLTTGDAVAFPGDVAHSYANGDRTEGRFSLAVFEPGSVRATHTGNADG